MIRQLAEAGKLQLDVDMRQYCPAFPAKPYTITTRQLLAHLSGIRHYGGPHDKEEQSSTKHYDGVIEALAPFKDDPLLFEPGTKHLYSTYGYELPDRSDFAADIARVVLGDSGAR